MAALMPVGLHMNGRRAVVIGGGRGAAAAAGRLLTAGADVLVVAPAVCAGLADLEARRFVSVERREYRPGDLEGAWLVLACGPADVNASALAEAQDRRVWAVSGPAGQPAQGSAALLPEPAEQAGPAGLAGLAGRAPGGHRVLVLGGARSGKSATAEAMLAGVPAVEYVAAGQPAGAGDAEWDERVREHRARRPVGWQTLETGAVADVLASRDADVPVLVDCLATWLARVMDECGLWSGAADSGARLAERTDGLIAAWQHTRRHVIAVSNEVGCGVVPATVSGRRFRDELGRLNSRIAAASDEVWLCTAGIGRRLR